MPQPTRAPIRPPVTAPAPPPANAAARGPATRRLRPGSRTVEPMAATAASVAPTAVPMAPPTPRPSAATERGRQRFTPGRDRQRIINPSTRAYMSNVIRAPAQGGALLAAAEKTGRLSAGFGHPYRVRSRNEIGKSGKPLHYQLDNG